MIPNEIQKAIHSVLGENEKILWQGSPALDATNKPEWNSLFYAKLANSIVLTIVTVAQIVINQRNTARILETEVPSGLFPLIILLIIVNLGLFCLDYVQVKRKVKKRGYLANFRTEVYYAVTNQRVLYFYDRKVNQAYREKSFQELNQISLQDWSDNYKSIVFGENQKISLIWANAQQDGADFPPFLDIKNAEQVYELILQQKDRVLAGC